MNDGSPFAGSDHLSSEERLAFLEEALQTIGQIGGEGLLILGSDLRIIWLNEQALTILGYPLPDLIHQEIFFLFSPQDRSVIRDMLQTPISRSRFKVTSEVKLVRPQGETKDVELSLFPVPVSSSGTRFMPWSAISPLINQWRDACWKFTKLSIKLSS